MKKLFYTLFLSGMLLLSVSCTEQPSIEGYWLNEFGESLAFDGEGTVVINDSPATYSIYDEDKIQIVFDGIFQSAAFNGAYYIEDEILYLTNLDNGETVAYYGNSEDQTVIRKAIAEAEAEEQRIAEEQKAAKAAKTERENQIFIIRDKISKCETEIRLLNNQIESYYYHIEDAKQSIAGLYEDIAQREISLKNDITTENKEYLQLRIDEKYADIAYYEEMIEDYKEQILRFEEEIINFEEEIQDLTNQLSQYE